MINRPPTPEEAFTRDELFTQVPYSEDECVQEALTCEWLIAQGLMPDPADLLCRDCKNIGEHCGYYSEHIDGWTCEDKTQ